MQSTQVSYEIIYDHEKGIWDPGVISIADVMGKLRGAAGEGGCSYSKEGRKGRMERRLQNRDPEGPVLNWPEGPLGFSVMWGILSDLSGHPNIL